MKKIVMLSNLDIWSIEEGKGAPSFYNTIKAYVDAGWDITLIQPFSKYRKDYKVGSCKMIKFNNTFFDFFNRIPKIRYFFRFLAYVYANYQFNKIASKLISKEPENYVVYAYEIFGVKTAKKLSAKYNVPMVTRFQGTILDGIKPTLFNKIRRFPHFGSLGEKSNLVIMTNDGTHGDKVLKTIGNNSPLLFPRNGQDPVKSTQEIKQANIEIRNKYNIKKEDTVLLTVSRLKNWKKVDRAINAFAKLLKSKPSTYLIIVGDGDEFDNLNTLAKELKVDKNVIFTGGLKQSEIWKYYATADIFLSLYDLSNVGNPLMEAMRYGKAIITINNGDTSEIITHNFNGILLETDQLDNVDKSIENLINNTSLANKLSKNALDYASKEFVTWDERMVFELKEVSKL